VQGWPTEDLVAKKVLSELVIFELGSEWWERARLAEIYFKNIFFFWFWGLNSGLTPWATLPALFLWRVFWDRVSQTFCPGWLWTLVLLISASWVAGITGVSHWCQA
jgi:hypothetical protein